MIYPEINDPDFIEKITSKEEFNIKKDTRYLEPNQIFAGNYISEITPYSNLLVFYKTGVGKTNSAINIISQFPDKKKLVLVKNNVIKKNFKRQLKLFEENVEEPGKIEFITYGTFVNNTIGSKNSERVLENDTLVTRQTRTVQGEKINSLNDTVIVVDEAHNITNNDQYTALRFILNKSKRYNLILLTATPMTDSVREIFELANLLNDTQLPIREDLKKEGYITEEKEDLFSVDKLTKKGKSVLKEAFKGKVSYLDTDKSTFPKVIEKGVRLNSDSHIKVEKCFMSNFQLAEYKKAYNLDTSESQRNTLFQRSTEAGLAVTPFKADESHSIKFTKLLRNIQNTQGTVFIYSNLITGGIELLEKFFKQKGVKSFKTIQGNTPDATREQILKTFNDPSNKYGEKIKILIGSRVLAEGVTLKRVRQIHILEPHWNYSLIQQIIGRVVRNRSHFGLPKNQQNVEVFKYVAVGSEKMNYIDLLKYQISEKKDIYIKQGERLLKKIAVDCYFNRERNILDSSENNTRECDYRNCNYKCDGNKGKVTKRTYTTHFNKREIKKAEKQIQDLFSRFNILSEKEIINVLGYESVVVHEALTNLLGTFIKGPKISGELESVTDSGEEFYFINNGKVKSLFDFEGKYPKTVKKSISEFLESQGVILDQETEVEQVNTAELTKQQLKENEQISKNKVFGKYKNKFDEIDFKFRIVDNRNEETGSDKRKINLGKVCNTYKKTDLENLSKFLGVDVRKGAERGELCHLIEEFLKSKKLILN